MGNCLFLLARGWGIDRQVRKKFQIPGGMPGEGMVTGRIEPCISSTMLAGSFQLVVPWRVRLLGRVRILVLPVRTSADHAAGEIG